MHEGVIPILHSNQAAEIYDIHHDDENSWTDTDNEEANDQCKFFSFLLLMLLNVSIFPTFPSCSAV